MKKQKKPLYRVASACALLAIVILQILPIATVSANQIAPRSLILQAGAGGDGGSKPGGVVNHLFNFTVPTAGNVGSILFKYCTTASDPADPTVTGACTVPTGLDTTTATLGDESTSDIQGFTIKSSVADGTSNGLPYLTRTVAATSANAHAVLRLDHITNPTTKNQTFFVRIYTFASTNVTGPATDAGTVAASTADPVILSGTMPESLVFCTGATIGVNSSNVPDCATATAASINFNQLFSPTDTATATSQFAASTNAGAGYSISANGATLTSGTNTIAPIGTMAPGVHGVSQFGLNLVANTTATSTVAVGSNIAVASNGTNYRGEPTASYGTVDNFKYVSGDPIADSGGPGNTSPAGTDAQIYTTSYIVNVPGSQPAGTYTTTLTYICTPTF